jgi:hypothetical protein
MFADLSKLTPIRESDSSRGAPRRRRGQDGASKVPARREHPEADQEQKPSQERGQGLNAYA